MAVNMSKKDQDALSAAGAKWNAATTQAEKDAAHAEAEAIRAKYNYSGGADGSQNISLSSGSSGNKSGNSQYTTAADKNWRDYVGMTQADQAELSKWGEAWNNAATQSQKDYAHQMAEQIREKYNYSGGDDGSEYNPLFQDTFGGFSYDRSPSYQDKYADRIDEMLNQILNRDKFSYNAEDDPLFSQYRDQYNREGNLAMQDTLGQVSARTGGLASSYAVSAAQQANQYYAQQLADKIPELYQLAYDMYLNDIDMQVQDLGLLQNASNTAYNRYRDTMNDWRSDRDFAYGAYRDDVADGQWQTQFDYNAGRDQIADKRYDQEWQYGLDRDKIEDSRYDKEWAYKVAQGAKSGKYSGSGKTSGENAADSRYASLDYDEDEGIFTWNGKQYSSPSRLMEDINAANLPQSQMDELARKLYMFGFVVN